MSFRLCFCWAALILLAPSLALAQERKESDDPIREAADALEGGKYDQAIAKFTEGIARAYRARGIAHAAKGDLDKALADYNESIRLNAEDPIAYYNRGNVYKEKGSTEKAIADYSEAIRLDRQFMMAYGNRANVYKNIGNYDKAVADYNQAIRIDPGTWINYDNLAWLLATCPKKDVRSGKKAVELARKACDLDSWKNAWRLDTLAAAYAEAGDFKEAVKWAKEAVNFGTDYPKKKLEEIQTRLKLYEAGKPYRETPRAVNPPAGQPRHQKNGHDLAAILTGLGYEQIPIQDDMGDLFIVVAVNGTKRSFVIDSGSPISALDWTITAALKLRISTERKQLAAFGGQARSGWTQIDSLRIGRTPIAGSGEIYVIDLAHINNADAKRAGARNVDGLIGGDVLAKFSAIIDFDGHQLFLLSPEKHKRMFEGNWRCETFEANGVSDSSIRATDISLTVGAKTLSLTSGQRKLEGEFSLDLDSLTPTIEVTSVTPKGKKQVRRGIAKFDAEHLVLCLSAPGSPQRPKSFSTARTDCETWVFKRSQTPSDKSKLAIGPRPSHSIDAHLKTLGYQSIETSADPHGYLRANWTINHSQTGEFLIDTECKNVLFDQKLVSKLKMKVEQLPDTETLGGRVPFSRLTDKVTLTIGRFESRNTAVDIFDFKQTNYVLEQLGSRSVDGIIGSDVLSRHGAVINYATGRIYLLPH